MTVAAALAYYGKHMGQTESPPYSNHVFAWTDYQRIYGPLYQGSAWCGGMLCDACHAGGWKAPADWIAVTRVQDWGQANGRWHYGSAGVRKGDALVIGGRGVHVEMAASDVRHDGSVLSDGGNTTPAPGSGKPFDGGCVASKVRSAAEVFGHTVIHDLLGGGRSPKVVHTAPDYHAEPKRGNLREWMKGPRVKAVQAKLGTPADSYFGPDTLAAVKAFQSAHGLEVDGIVGPATLRALGIRPTIKRRVKRAVAKVRSHLVVDSTMGPATMKALQRALGVTADGWFRRTGPYSFDLGPETTEALQRKLSVKADGSCGPVTVRALQRHLGVAADSDWGKATTRALQRALNRGTF
jgi:peptidoglycan hydrolase-like protein with peptidoglycan-binding domain